MILHALVAALLAGAVDFEVQSLDGRTVAGRLVELDAGKLALETADGRVAFELAALAGATRRGSPAAPQRKATAQLELVDGSRLSLADFTVGKGIAKTLLASGTALEIPTRSIRWVRFADPAQQDAALDKQWADIAGASAGGDVLVVRKKEALDYHEGTAGDVDADIFNFEIEKDAVAVKRPKVEGVVYFHAAAAELPEPLGSLTTADGSRLALRGATLAGESIKVETPLGMAVEVKLDEIARLDFSAGKIAYLSDLDPETATYVPLVGFKDAPAALAEFYQYRRDTGFEAAPLRLDGKTYRKGLALATRSVLSYKLPGKFRVFKATVGIDDSTGDAGNVRLVVKGDGKTLWQGDVQGDEPARELEVEIGGVKRLEILADYGADLDIGDRLDLCEARVTK